jgi:hypothetical protein
VSFGPNNLIFPGRNNNRLEEMKEGGIPIPRIVPPAKRRTGVSRLGSARSQPSEGKVHHPRSLAEYCVLGWQLALILGTIRHIRSSMGLFQ